MVGGMQEVNIDRAAMLRAFRHGARLRGGDFDDMQLFSLRARARHYIAIMRSNRYALTTAICVTTRTSLRALVVARR